MFEDSERLRMRAPLPNERIGQPGVRGEQQAELKAAELVAQRSQKVVLPDSSNPVIVIRGAGAPVFARPLRPA
jgi:hypothetical protein